MVVQQCSSSVLTSPISFIYFISQKSHDFPMIGSRILQPACPIRIHSVRIDVTSDLSNGSLRDDSTRPGTCTGQRQSWRNDGKIWETGLFYSVFSDLITWFQHKDAQTRYLEIGVSLVWNVSSLSSCPSCPEAIPCLKSKARRQIARERRRA